MSVWDSSCNQDMKGKGRSIMMTADDLAPVPWHVPWAACLCIFTETHAQSSSAYLDSFKPFQAASQGDRTGQSPSYISKMRVWQRKGEEVGTYSIIPKGARVKGPLVRY